MSFIELIGFVITMIALMMLSYRQSKDAKKRQDEDEYSPERLKQDPAVQQLLRTMKIEVKTKKPEPIAEPPRKKPVKAIAPVSDPYNESKTSYQIRKNVLKNVSLKEAMILHTILGPPKGK